MHIETMNVIARRFNGLEQAAHVAAYAREHSDLVEGYIQSFGHLINRFNLLHKSDPVLLIMPRTRALMAYVDEGSLPTIAQMQTHFWHQRFLLGLDEAVLFLMRGVADAQSEKEGQLPEYHSEEKILFGTLQTNANALLVGAIGHLLERTIFHGLEPMISGFHFVKDDILIPLEDMLLLEHFSGTESPLFPVFTNSPSLDATGGLGWISSVRLEEFDQGYARISGNDS